MKLEIFVDYTCPFCYLAMNYLEELAPSYPDLAVKMHVCEAHPLPEPRMEHDETSNWWIHKMKKMADDNGIPIAFPHNPIPYSSLAIQGLCYLEAQNGINVNLYNKRMFGAVYQESKDIEDIDVVLSGMTDLGVDLTDARKALESGRYKEDQLSRNEFAYLQNEVTVLPTYLCGGKRIEAQLGIGITREALQTFLDECSQ